jgi:hypothetical protein
MRPAPPRQPRPGDDAASSTEPSTALDGQSNDASRKGGRRRLAWVAAAVVGLAVAGLALWSFTRGSTPSTRTATPAASPTVSPPTPVRPAFVFNVRSRQPAATGRLKRGAADDASAEIGSNLSAFYDTAFLDPTTWKEGIPKSAWSIFDPSAADQAMKDAKDLTLGDEIPDLASLSVDESSLAVKVLLDAGGKPLAAVARVDFVAVGALQSGDKVTVTNHADLVLKLEGGKWLVVGYRNASTDVEGGAGIPSPSASP